MRRAKKFAQGAYDIFLALFFMFLVDYGVQFGVMSLIEKLPVSHHDVLLGIAGLILIIVGFLVRFELQKKFGFNVSLGLAVGLIIVGISFCVGFLGLSFALVEIMEICVMLVPPVYKDIVLGLIATAFVLFSFIVVLNLQEKIGDCWASGLFSVLMAIGFEFGKKSMWWQGKIKIPLMIMFGLFVVVWLAIELFKKVKKRNHKIV